MTASRSSLLLGVVVVRNNIVVRTTAVADAVIVDGKGNVVEDGPVDYNAVGHRL